MQNEEGNHKRRHQGQPCIARQIGKSHKHPAGNHPQPMMIALEVQIEHPKGKQGKKDKERFAHRHSMDGKQFPACNEQGCKNDACRQRWRHPPAEDTEQSGIRSKK